MTVILVLSARPVTLVTVRATQSGAWVGAHTSQALTLPVASRLMRTVQLSGSM